MIVCLLYNMNINEFLLKRKSIVNTSMIMYSTSPHYLYLQAIDVFMSGCTVFVFLSLMEYALVNIVMGDIADIEKKKNSGLTNLLLGVRAPGLGMAGSLKQQKSFQAMQELSGSHEQADHKPDNEVGILILTHLGLPPGLSGRNKINFINTIQPTPGRVK